MLPQRDIDKILYSRRPNPVIVFNILVGLASAAALVEAWAHLSWWCGLSLTLLFLSWLAWFFKGANIR